MNKQLAIATLTTAVACVCISHTNAQGFERLPGYNLGSDPNLNPPLGTSRNPVYVQPVNTPTPVPYTPSVYQQPVYQQPQVTRQTSLSRRCTRRRSDG